MFASRFDKPHKKAAESPSNRLASNPTRARSSFIPVSPSSVIQPKLVIGHVNDPLEDEADRAADAVMAMNGSAPALSGNLADEKERDTISGISGIPPLANRALRSPGQALAPKTRSFFENAYHHDFGRVRVHASSEAAESAAALGARAYTTGSHIVLGGSPHAKLSPRLLAHELAHVVQQGAAAALSAPGMLRLTLNSNAPSLQRQPLPGGDWKPEKVKSIIKDKDTTPGQEIWSVIDKNDLKGTASVVRSAVIEGKQHQWRITIKPQMEGTAFMPGPHGRTGDITTSKQGDLTVHTIPVSVNTILGSSEEEKMLFPSGHDVERVNFMAARTLYHEVMHALIAIDSQLPSSEKRSQATAKYEDLRARAANDPEVIAAKEAILSTLSAMVSNAEGAIGVPDLFDPAVKTPYPTRTAELENLKKSEGLDKIIGAGAVSDVAAVRSGPMDHPSLQRRKFLEDSITMLISEKNARQETGKAFGLPNYASNKRTAADYALNMPKTIQELARVRSGNFALNLRTSDVWQTAEQTLLAQVETFFAKLDIPPVPPIPELIPGLKSSPLDLPKPAPLNP